MHPWRRWRFVFTVMLLGIVIGCAQLPEYARPRFHMPENPTAASREGFTYRPLKVEDFKAPSLPSYFEQFNHHINAHSCISIRPSRESKARITPALYGNRPFYVGSIPEIRFDPAPTGDREGRLVIPFSTTLNIEVSVVNRGNEPEADIPVRLRLLGLEGDLVFDDAQVIDALEPGAAASLLFPDLPVQPGEFYEVVLFADLGRPRSPGSSRCSNRERTRARLPSPRCPRRCSSSSRGPDRPGRSPLDSRNPCPR